MAWPQAHQPYSGLETRPIKALSDQQIADPGPMHVLELAEPLGLTQSQRERMAALFEAMKAGAMVLGEKLIAAEADLDRQFAGKTITDAGPAWAMGCGTWLRRKVSFGRRT